MDKIPTHSAYQNYSQPITDSNHRYYSCSGYTSPNSISPHTFTNNILNVPSVSPFEKSQISPDYNQDTYDNNYNDNSRKRLRLIDVPNNNKNEKSEPRINNQGYFCFN